MRNPPTREVFPGIHLQRKRYYRVRADPLCSAGDPHAGGQLAKFQREANIGVTRRTAHVDPLTRLSRATL